MGAHHVLHPGVHTASRYYLPDTEYPIRTYDNNLQNAIEAEVKGTRIKWNKREISAVWNCRFSQWCSIGLHALCIGRCNLMDVR